MNSKKIGIEIELNEKESDILNILMDSGMSHEDIFDSLESAVHDWILNQESHI